MSLQRVINRDSAAQQRSGLLAIEVFGDGNHKAGIGSNAVSVSAMAMNAGSLSVRAKVFKPLHAPLAPAAGVRLPAKSDALTYLDARTSLPNAETVPIISWPGMNG